MEKVTGRDTHPCLQTPLASARVCTVGTWLSRKQETQTPAAAGRLGSDAVFCPRNEVASHVLRLV